MVLLRQTLLPASSMHRRVIRATVRHFAKFLTIAALSIGFFIAIFTRKRQTLHDLIAGCVVISKTK